MAADLLTTAEVARALRVTVSTVNRYARDGSLPAITLPGGMRRYRSSDVAALLALPDSTSDDLGASA